MSMRHIVAGACAPANQLEKVVLWDWLTNLQGRVSQRLFLNDACQKISFLNYLFCFSNNAFVI